MRRVTRREVLAGITAAGAAGAVSGVGTAAMLVDRETLANGAAAGRVELLVDVGDGATNATDGPIAVPVPSLEPGDTATVDLSLLVPAEAGVNPAYLWVRAGCAAPSSLVDALRLSLVYADGAGEQLFEGTYGELLSAFRDGVPLDASGRDLPAGSQSCLAPGTAVHLTIDYELPDDYVGEGTATTLIEAIAVQCRRVDPAERPVAFDAPLGLADCTTEPPNDHDPCPCCVRIGKYELNGANELTPGQYAFTEGAETYLLTVDDVEENGDGEAIAARFGVVLADDPSTAVDVCRIEVKSGGGGGSTPVFIADGEATDDVVGTDGKGISHVTVSICAAHVERDGGQSCPDDLIRDPSLDGGRPNGGRSSDTDGTDHDDDEEEDRRGGGPPAHAGGQGGDR